MQKYKVRTGDAVWLDEEAEHKITMYLRGAIKKYRIKCFAYNICGDHVHMLFACDRVNLPSIVRTLKSISAREYNISTGITKVNPGDNRKIAQNHLWSQKYSSTLITNEKQFQQKFVYIEHNREKHGLPPLDSKTKFLIRDMIIKASPQF